MRFWMFFGLALVFTTPVFAQNMTSDGQVNELTPNNVAKNTMALTPEMRQKFMTKFQEMTPQQRQAITNQAQQAWQSMSPQNKDLVKEKAMEQWQALTPEQKQDMQKEAMQKWQGLSQQDKQQLIGQFQGILQSGPQ